MVSIAEYMIPIIIIWGISLNFRALRQSLAVTLVTPVAAVPLLLTRIIFPLVFKTTKKIYSLSLSRVSMDGHLVDSRIAITEKQQQEKTNR